MKRTAKELKNLSEDQLAEVAGDLGLQLNADNTSKATFIAEIIEAQEDDAEVVGIDEPIDEPVVVKKPKKFRILVSNQEGVEQTEFVKVQVDGVMYALPREVEVVVPEIVVEVLNNAVVTRYAQEGGLMVERKARRFPFQVLGEAK
jgi:hypothetical protein